MSACLHAILISAPEYLQQPSTFISFSRTKDEADNEAGSEAKGKGDAGLIVPMSEGKGKGDAGVILPFCVEG